MILFCQVVTTQLLPNLETLTLLWTVFLQAWRARSLHLFLMDLCGLHSGTPLDVLTRAHVRSMPQVFHRESTAAGSLQYMPDAHAYDAVRATVPFDGSRVKLSPLLVALCMPVRNVLLVYGAEPRIKTEFLPYWLQILNFRGGFVGAAR